MNFSAITVTADMFRPVGDISPPWATFSAVTVMTENFGGARFGFSSTPRAPSVTDVVTTIIDT